jgi:alpha-amylase
MVWLLANAFFPDPAFPNDPRNHRISVPCPVDPDTPHVPWWTDKIASLGSHFKRVGITKVMWPPLCKTQSGAFPTATGYGVFDPYDIGSKLQMGSIPTRFGMDWQLQRAIAVLLANGIGSHADMVLHQMAGGREGFYSYKGCRTEEHPDGVPDVGRFPRNPGYFRGGVDGKTIPPFVKQDSVPDPFNDFPFGDECSYQNSQPRDAMTLGTLEWAEWYANRLDLDGVRVDDCKGLWVPFVELLLKSGKRMSKLKAIGEYFDGNPRTLHWYAWMLLNGRMSLLDFNVHFAIKAVLDYGHGMWALRTNQTWAAWDSFQSVPFVETPDTDMSPGQQITSSKLLGYAYILQHSLGEPMIYHKDYSSDPGCYGLGPKIDNMIWCHNHLVGGPAIDRWVDQTVLVTERQGYKVGKPGCISAINNDGLNDRTITVPSSFGAYAHFHDYNGLIPDVYADRNGEVTFTIPHNTWYHGDSHVCLGPAGVEDGPRPPPRMTTQVFEAASDDSLDIAPIANAPRDVARVWCKKGSPVTATMHLVAPLPLGERAQFMLRTAQDGLITTAVIGQGLDTAQAIIEAPRDGWVEIGTQGFGLANPVGFSTPVEYQATEELAG